MLKHSINLALLTLLAVFATRRRADQIGNLPRRQLRLCLHLRRQRTVIAFDNRT